MAPSKVNKPYTRGSISLSLILICCFLSLIAVLIMYLFQEAYETKLLQIRLLQLRTLAGSAITNLAKQSTLEEGTHRLGAVTLYPGKLPATLDYSYQVSNDKCFAHLSTRAATSKEYSRFQKFYFYPSWELQQLAEAYGIVCTYGVKNSQYLPQGTLYTSNGNFNVPALDLLTVYGKTSLDQEEFLNNGGNGSFVYINSSSSQTRLPYVAATPVTKGTLLLASHGNILLEKNFHAADRLILITDRGTITLEDNVTLDAALIISRGSLTIGKNCKLRGSFMVQDRVVLQGSCKITQDPSVVAPFESPITSLVE